VMEQNEKHEITKLQELAYELRVEQAMTKEVISVTPETTMTQIREILRDNRISGLPVVKDGQMIGLVTVEDLIKALSSGQMGCPASDMMTPNPVTIYADELLVSAVEKFTKHGYGRFPVINRQGELVGILTHGDIVRATLKRLETDYHKEEIHRYRASHIFQDIVADRVGLVFGYQVVARDFNRAGEVSSKLKKTLGRLGIHPQIIRRVSIATYEAEMNMVIYTEGGEIVAEVRPDRIRVDALDKGPGIANIEEAMKPGFSTAPDWVREMGFGAGMGLPNIKASSDKLTIDSTLGVGTHLTFIVEFPKDLLK